MSSDEQVWVLREKKISLRLNSGLSHSSFINVHPVFKFILEEFTLSE